MSILAKVEARIAVVRAELARLENARDVLSELADPPRHRVRPPRHRVRKPPAEMVESPVTKAKMRDRVLAALSGGPKSAGELFRTFDLKGKHQKQVIYRIFYELKGEGLAERFGESGTYRLTPPASANEATAPH